MKYIMVVLMILFVSVADADNINTFHSNGLTNNFNTISNNYTLNVNATTCNPANEASSYNGTGFECVNISTDISNKVTKTGDTLSGDFVTSGDTTLGQGFWNRITFYSSGLIDWLTYDPSTTENSYYSKGFQYNYFSVANASQNIYSEIYQTKDEIQINFKNGSMVNTTFNKSGIYGIFPELQITESQVTGLTTDLNSKLPIATYNGNFPNSTLSNYLLIATYSGNFPNTTVATNSATWTSKEPAITAGTSLQYWRGDKTMQTLNTLAVPELTNLYYTDARARAASSATAPIAYSGSGVISISQPAPMLMTNATATCTDTTNGGAGKMMGFWITHTTASTGGTGAVYVTLNFQITSPATASLNTQYQFSYGTGTPPACNAAKTGTQIGQIYTFVNPAAVATKNLISETVVITGLSSNTAYWFDVNVIDSSTGAWIYSLPQVSIKEQ